MGRKLVSLPISSDLRLEEDLGQSAHMLMLIFRYLKSTLEEIFTLSSLIKRFTIEKESLGSGELSDTGV
jgi:hypothetical protein